LVVQTNQKAREKGADMLIMGADYHPAFQQIAFVDSETGEPPLDVPASPLPQVGSHF
jgi:hypothetical protein